HDKAAYPDALQHHFRRDHALYGAAHAQTNAGHDRRHGCGQDDLEKNLSFFGAEGARHLDKNSIDLFYTRHGVDDDDKDGKEKNHGDARLDAKNKPQDQDRHEGGGRRRHQRVDVKIQEVLDGAEAPHEHPDDDAKQDSQEKYRDQRGKTHSQIGQQLAAGKHLPPGGADL